jgi:hypothetical protein
MNGSVPHRPLALSYRLKLALHPMEELKLKGKVKKRGHWWGSVVGLENGAASGLSGCPGRQDYNDL